MNGTDNSRLAQAAGCLGAALYRAIEPYFSKLEKTAQEIRLRVNRPAAVVCRGKTWYLTRGGSLTDLPCGDLLTVSRSQLDEVFARLCDYSVYAHRREIAHGYITLRGGHRAGICGTAVASDGRVTNVRDISSVNLRIAREHRGCAEAVFRAVDNGGMLLCGPPCSGKTTVLRDLARLLSQSDGQNVSLIDERGELAACCRGEPQNDVGLCDVFDGYPKAAAMEQALRAMAPATILCDEIGGEEDAAAVAQCVNSGVRLIATAHAADERELYGRAALRQVLATGAFSTLVFLKGRERAGQIATVVRAGESRAA